MPPDIAVVLPPRERFSANEAGAVALLVRRLAAHPGAFRPVVIGAEVVAPFGDVPFIPAAGWFYAAAVHRAVRGVRLIEVHNRPALALALARSGKTPVALFLHNDPRGMRQARTARERTRLLRRLSRVVVVSEYLRGLLLEGVDTPPPRPPIVLPNCINLARMPPPAQRDRTILLAGRVVADKGADSFVDACARALPALPGWRAEILGADRFGEDSPETPFLRALRPRAAAAGVTLTGYRPHPDVLAAMGRAAMVVVPSRWAEPFGMTALEAMACGAPLLCSNRGGLAEVTGDAAVPIDPDDPAGMAERMIALARDPDRRAALSAAGLCRARLFDLPAAAARLDALRTEMLASWSPPVRHLIWRPSFV